MPKLPGLFWRAVHSFVEWKQSFCWNPYYQLLRAILVTDQGEFGPGKDTLEYPVGQIDGLELHPTVLNPVKPLQLALAIRCLDGPATPAAPRRIFEGNAAGLLLEFGSQV